MSDGINVHADGSDVQSVFNAKKRGRYKNLLALPNTFLCECQFGKLGTCSRLTNDIRITWQGWLELHKEEIGWSGPTR
jgi:hypothetical protein